MKKIFSFVSVIAFALTLAACQSKADVTNPVIKGANDATIQLNSTFDPKAGVTASDNHDGDLTSSIEIYGTVDTSKEGDYVLRYKVIDKAGNKVNVLRKITVEYDCTPSDGQLYCNGDFVAGTSGWETYIQTDNGSAGEFTVTDGVGKFAITTIGDSSLYWSHQLLKKNLTIEQGKSYLLTFKAKADADRKISAVVEDPKDDAGGSYYQYGKYQVYDVTTDWQNFELYFDATKGTVSAQVGLFFGKVADDTTLTNVYLDDIILKEITARPDETPPVISGATDSTIELGTTFDATSGVTATDNKDGDITSSIAVSGTVDTNTAGIYTLTYTVTDAAGNITTVDRAITVTSVIFDNSGLIANGDFSNPLNAETPEWSKVANDGADFSYSVVNGELVVDVTNGGGNPWSSQIVYGGITLEKGKAYNVVFKAKADTARSINVSGGETLSADPWWRGFFSHTFNLTTSYQIFEYTFVMQEDTFTNTDFKFEFGTGTTNKIYFDNLMLKEDTNYVDTVDPVISGASDTTLELGATFDPTAGVTASDNKDGDLTSSIQVSGETVDTSTPGIYTVTYTVADAAGNDVTVNRVITVVALIFNDTNKIVNGDFSDNTDTITNAATETGWKEWHQDWSSPASVTYTINESGQLEANITSLGDQWQSWTIQLQQGGITLEKGKTYKIVFDAKSSVARDIKSVMKTTSDDVYTEKVFTLTDTMTTYEQMFTVTKDTNTDMVFTIEMGTFTDTPAASLITLDNIKIQELAEAPVLTNGDMTTTTDLTAWWGDDGAGYATGDVSVVDGVLQANIQNVGNAAYSPQLYQAGLLIKGDRSYNIEFDIKADVARSINVQLGEPLTSDPWFTPFMDAYKVDVTTGWQHVVIPFDMLLATNENGKLVFELGQITDASGASVTGANTIYLDNVIIYPDFN